MEEPRNLDPYSIEVVSTHFRSAPISILPSNPLNPAKKQLQIFEYAHPWRSHVYVFWITISKLINAALRRSSFSSLLSIKHCSLRDCDQQWRSIGGVISLNQSAALLSCHISNFTILPFLWTFWEPASITILRVMIQSHIQKCQQQINKVYHFHI